MVSKFSFGYCQAISNHGGLKMDFKPERLISLRQSLGINKAEAARRLNISAMGYGRYESGERTVLSDSLFHRSDFQ
ncbi:helix-turn-helix domain-containing protein [Fusicatenibacter saccharivorans]|uniref:helix-turn-helix domain-containing protein n=1 Tax=Fusicatenibacter saccharivorans TaxID=1150298 RepID=UPI003F932469